MLHQVDGVQHQVDGGYENNRSHTMIPGGWRAVVDIIV
jgi:very-short-patch-repair endonuclease